MASSIEALRAADVALIDAVAAVNDAFADELAALNVYAATLDRALEARRVGLETALDLYAGAMEELMGIAAHDQLDFLVTGVPALGAMGAVRAAAHEANHTAREVGFQGIQDAAYNATGERERSAALDAFAEGSPGLLAAIEDSYTAAEALNVATSGLGDAFTDVLSERTPPRHGNDYAMATMATLEAVDAGAIREAVSEAAREAYATSPKAAFDAAVNLLHEHFSSAIAAVPTPTPTPHRVGRGRAR